LNDYHNFLRSRRSVRRFDARPVKAETLRHILETATYAPSAHNLQPWRFAVVQDSAAKSRLGQALTGKMRADMAGEGAPADEIERRVSRSLRRIDQAPVIVLLCRDASAVRKDEPEEHTMAVQSVAAAGLQLLLAAQAEGLSGNWICWPLYAPEATRAALDFPKTWEPQAMIILGYSIEEPEAKELKLLGEIVLWK
jgi:coenzyme F420-0:L-glutamate ligase/coenzyme F420-1:gamma-L-glutamate ligase